jgi:hypothetical protein
MNIEELIKEYKENTKKLKKEIEDGKILYNSLNEIKNNKNELWYKLEDKKITIEQYKEQREQKEKEEEEIKIKYDLNKIKTKLYFDNEDIINKKIMVYIKNNILNKYNNKAIGEKTTEKIDGEIKELLKDIYNDNYINVYEYNDYFKYLPNQFINVYKASNSWDYDYYTSYLYFNLKSKYNHDNNGDKLKLYIKDNKIKYNQYSKMEEIDDDNKKEEEKIINTSIIKNVNIKASEILKAYNKKEKLIKKYTSLLDKTKEDFKNTLKDNNNNYLSNIYYYFNN